MNTENLMNLTLTHGSHRTPEEGMCLMEAVAYLAGQEHSDEPACACPVIAAFARTINDQMGAGPKGDTLRAKHLLPIAQKLIGTRSTPEVEQKRMYFFADRAVRLFAPLALEAAGLTEEAETLRSLPEIVDEQTAEAAGTAAVYASYAASAAYAASATYAAAWAAARAASAAADASAASAAWAADASAAWAADAADAAAYVAARAADAADRTAAGAAWAQAAQVLSEACEISLEGGE